VIVSLNVNVSLNNEEARVKISFFNSNYAAA
jgi:hypothetical protein